MFGTQSKVCFMFMPPSTEVPITTGGWPKLRTAANDRLHIPLTSSCQRLKAASALGSAGLESSSVQTSDAEREHQNCCMFGKLMMRFTDLSVQSQRMDRVKV
jgi:hypothetical protein